MKNKSALIFFIIVSISIVFAETSNNNESNTSTLRAAIEAMSNPNYLVTTGDIYELCYLAGSRAVSYKIIVDTSYNIRVSNLSVINAQGLTFPQLKRRVENIVVKNYPMSGVQFSLISPGIFSVIVKGEVINAFEAKLTALTRLSDIIKSNFTNYSSMRDIEVISASGKKRQYDLFEKKRNGDFSQDPFLRPGDTIIVNKLDRSVSISGNVERPGTYQILKEENIKEMIEYYGHGLTQSADLSTLTVYRTIDSESSPLGNVFFLDTEEKRAEFVLKDRDHIVISNKASRRPVIYFEGALDELTASEKRKKEKEDDNKKDAIEIEGSAVIPVQFTPGDNLISMIRARRSWFSAKSDTYNAYLLRGGKKIPINLNKIFYDLNYNEFMEVLPDDRLIVPFLQLFVTVSGAVAVPGRYPYSPDRNWEYYIALAGGFNTDKNVGKAVTIKDVYGKKLNKTDPIFPETTITAKANSFAYNFNRYAPIITASAAVVTATVAVLTFVYKKD